MLGLMTIEIRDDIQPKAVMTPDELARWNALPPGVQLARLRAAIQAGRDSGLANITMDELWAKVRARHSDARL